MKVGFIGLGIMGGRMAANLQKHGYDLVVFDRTRRKPLQRSRTGRSPSIVPAKWAIAPIFCSRCSPIPKLSQKQLWENAVSCLICLAIPCGWIAAPSILPFSRTMAREASDRQVGFLDAPVADRKIERNKGRWCFSSGVPRRFCNAATRSSIVWAVKSFSWAIAAWEAR